MNLYLEKFAEGVKEALEDHSSEPSIFDIKGGNMFPNNTSQKMWQFAKSHDHINFSDGMNTYSFKGHLNADGTSYIEKVPSVPLPDMFSNSETKGKAQVHRSSPGSIYFTLQEGKDNPTYTFRHSSADKWVAIPKARKTKKQMEEEPYIPNINVEHVKAGMEEALKEYIKEASGGLQGFFKEALGPIAQGLANLPVNAALEPGRLGGPETFLGDPNQFGSESGLRTLGRAGLMAGAGAGLGAGYHFLKRHLYNTPEENAAEQPDELNKRMMIPAAALGGASLLGRAMFPSAMNNPQYNMFS